MSDIYFAGLFDGEGCVTIDKTKIVGTLKTPSYRLTVQIAMIDRRPLDVMKRVYGGGVYLSSWTELTKAQGYRWCAVSRVAADFLRRIEPYLMVKPEEVEVALAFQEHVRRTPHGGKKQTAEASLKYREECRLKLQALKRRFQTRKSPGEP
jgi:hypothetical protein